MNKNNINLSLNIDLEKLYSFNDLAYDIKVELERAIMDKIRKSTQWKKFVRTQVEMSLKKITKEGIYNFKVEQVL
jgi:hypothetical protein